MNLLQVAADMGELAAAGVNSFKFFLAYKGAFAVTDAQLLKGLARCKELGALPMVHIPLSGFPIRSQDPGGSDTADRVSGALQKAGGLHTMCNSCAWVPGFMA